MYPVLEVTYLPNRKKLEKSANTYNRDPALRNARPPHSSSFIYDTFVRQKGMDKARLVNKWDWPAEAVIGLKGELFYWDADYDRFNPEHPLLTDERVVHSIDIDDIEAYDHGDENIAGFHFFLDMSKIDEYTERGMILKKILTDSRFPLTYEFYALHRWVEKCRDENTVSERGQSLLDIFGFES